MVNANAPSGKNIWIAASDGDIERVKVSVKEVCAICVG